MRDRYPLLVERIKIKIKEQGVDYFEYTGNFEPQPLLNKKVLLEPLNTVFNEILPINHSTGCIYADIKELLLFNLKKYFLIRFFHLN